MQLYEHLTHQNRDAVENLIRTYGIPKEQAASLLQTVLPELSRAVSRNTLSRGGIAGIVELLGKQNYEQYLSPAANLQDAKPAGVDALSEIFRTKAQSRLVAARAAKATGLPENTITGMLPQIAAIAMGGLSQQLQNQLGNLNSKLSAEQTARFGSVQSNIGQHQPLPMPGDEMLRGPSGAPPSGGGNPYGDLGDVIRRRGRIDGQAPGNIIRDILGQVLGFQNKGVVGWIIQFVIARYGWRIVRALFGRLLLGR